MLILCIINEINCLKKLIDIFNIQFQKKEARQKQTFCATFKLENRKEKYLWSFWKSEKVKNRFWRDHVEMQKWKKLKKVKKVKKSEKVKPKVNHFLKASETPKCTFPSPLVMIEIWFGAHIDQKSVFNGGKKKNRKNHIRFEFFTRKWEILVFFRNFLLKKYLFGQNQQF